MSNKHPEPIDFLLLTVLEKEFAAVARHVDVTPDTRTDDKYAFYRGTLKTENSDGTSDYSIALVQSNDMGNVAMSTAITNALERYSPQMTIVIGIAGGVKGEIMLGDVAVSKAILPYESGKVYEAGFESRAILRFADAPLFNLARPFALRAWHTRMTEKRPDEAMVAPAVKFGTVASGDKVIADENFVNQLRKGAKNLIAVEMEGSGAVHAVHAHGADAGGFLEIRGISDYADKEKADGWQEYAADAAAAFAIAYLESKPISSRRDRSQHLRPAARPFIALRAQSMARVNPIGIHAALRAYGATEIEDVSIDLMSFTDAGGLLLDAPGAVKALTDRSGPLLRAAHRAEDAELAFAGQVHIPLAVLAGALLSDRVPVRLLDFHSADGSNTWSWRAGDSDPFPGLNISRQVSDGGLNIAFVRVCLSYPVSVEQTEEICKDPRHEIDVRCESIALGVVRSEAQARHYAATVREILDLLANSDPRPTEIHLFYAGPVSVAFAIGQKYSASIHPRTIVWNYRDGKYDWHIDLRAALDTAR